MFDKQKGMGVVVAFAIVLGFIWFITYEGEDDGFCEVTENENITQLVVGQGTANETKYSRQQTKNAELVVGAIQKQLSLTTNEETKDKSIFGDIDTNYDPRKMARAAIAAALIGSDFEDVEGENIFGQKLALNPRLNPNDPVDKQSEAFLTDLDTDVADWFQDSYSVGNLVEVAIQQTPTSLQLQFADAIVQKLWQNDNQQDCPPEPTGPVGVESITTVRGFRVHKRIERNVEALLDAAENGACIGGIQRTAGASGCIGGSYLPPLEGKLGGWGWRDNATQIRLRREHCGRSQYAIYSMPSSRCSPPTARPGRSQHERGLAIDFTYNGLTIKSRGNPAYIWLKRTNNAEGFNAFGFKNLASEPWHWSTTGR